MGNRLMAAAVLAGGLACGGTDSVGPVGTCVEATGSVTATVATAGSVVFDWSPGCAVALLLVEEGSSDMWSVAEPNLDVTSTPASNIILPPVTYGQVPPGADEGSPPLALVAGTTYELILWKVVSANSTVQCQQRIQNACLLTLKTFQR